MKEVTDRLGVFLLPKERVIVVSAEQSGAVQFFLIGYSLRLSIEPNIADTNLFNWIEGRLRNLSGAILARWLI